MWCVKKEAVLLLFINVFHVHCRTVLKTQNINEEDNLLSLKGIELSECDCGDYGSCSLERGVKLCTCNMGYKELNGKCEECDCGGHGGCRLKAGVEICTCDMGYTEKNGKCEECDCGNHGSCKLETGIKVCTCDMGYKELNGKCEECDCGDHGSCSLEPGVKVCTCNMGYKELNGKCEEICNCGDHGRCSLETGVKVCICNKGYSERYGKCEECDCGDYGICHFEDGLKKCECAGLSDELDGKCVECNCGSNTVFCSFESDGHKYCSCDFKFTLIDGQCTECDCGLHGLCKFELGRKKCICGPDYIERDGYCVAKEFSSTVSSSLMTTILTSTVTYCYCGENSKSCSYNVFGEKECSCFSGYAQNREYCEECNCGPYGSCSFEYGRKRCSCKSFAVEKNGVCVEMESTTLEVSTAISTTFIPFSTTQYCNCGKNSKSCRFNLKGDKKCDCFLGYVENDGKCDECNCGPYGTCSFRDGRKRCHCRSFAVEVNGVCVDKRTSTSEGTTDSSTTYIIESSTVKDCDCGPFGRCTFENGRKKCICDSLTSEKDGKCVGCDCGKNTKSCYFDWKGDKTCNCTSGYDEVYGICKECNCGANAQYCFFRENGIKVCSCDFGYIETNGYCSAICNEDKCIHGKCEIDGNVFICRCNEGFTGQRCEEKIQTKSKKPNFWMILQVSVGFAIFLLLSCMFCFWTRALNKMSIK